MKIAPYKFVAVSYKLYADKEQDLIEETTEGQPLTFIFGTGSMLESFEKNLMGLAEGDSFDFTLSPKDAYGEYSEERVLELPKNIFEIDGVFDEEQIYEDAIVPMMDSEGNRLTGSVVSIGEEHVVMDFNHPLAGDTLHFVGKVEEVREPSKEELEMAQDSDGCDCGSCGDSDCASRN